MKTAIIGYPRVGNLRELKFQTENYFKKKITKDILEKKTTQLRRNQLKLIAESGIDFIPSNDFSYYDNMLDTAFLFNIIPERYKKLGFDSLDTYFSMARGYQGKHGDVKALPMKKWFNTNYHYIVPEFEEKTNVNVVGNKIFDEYLDAENCKIKTKPVLIGPFTLLKLSSYKGNSNEETFIAPVISAYKEVLERLHNLNVEWLELDEPYLITDLNKKDKELFLRIYTQLLSNKKSMKILLQTYFGDMRDIYNEVIKLDFDGIGLDFIEGKKTLELISQYGFPKDKLLFAGIVNGKNIWRNNYKNTINVLEKVLEYINKEKLVINTSCSLLHVPYTINNESQLSYEYKSHLAFAEEKLLELTDIKAMIIDNNYKNSLAYINNINLFEQKKSIENKEIKKQVLNLTEKDFVRNPSFEEREKLQREILKLPVFPTTTIGSFPQTFDVKANRTKYKQGKITEEQYKNNIKNKIKKCISLQEALDLDVLVHGEYERNDMVEYFGENLSGYLFTEKAWVQSYGTRCVKPPIIWGDIERKKPITVEYIKYAQSLTDRPVKGMLTGPVTILNWSFPREDISLKEMAFQLALAIKKEVLELEKSGIKIIQIDEAALKEKMPIRYSDWYLEYLDWAIPAFRLVHSGIKPGTQIHTHMCYSEFNDIIKEIENMDADVISFEASRSGNDILEAFKKSNFKTQVGPGVYDIHSPRVPSENEIFEIIYRMIKNENVNKEKLWINPDCGLKTRGMEETILSLKNLVMATKIARKELVN